MSFWTHKRVCVTGGSGFLGGYVVKVLRDRGCRDIFVPRQAQFDLVQPDAVRRLYDEAQPEVVIHLAARVGGIAANRAHPAQFFYDNLMMGVQLQHEGWRRGIAKFVGVGTVCGYPKHTPTPFHESELWNGYPEETNAPYGLAKKMLLVQAQAYREEYGFNAIFLLPVNLYGPGDNFDPETSHVIPALVRKCVDAQRDGAPSVTVWGDGTPTREFLYAADAAEAIVLAAERYDGAEPVNIGSACEISIRDLAVAVADAVGYHGRIEFDGSRPNGQPRRKLDISRAREQFGFEARTPFEAGLRATVDWYRLRYARGAA